MRILTVTNDLLGASAIEGILIKNKDLFFGLDIKNAKTLVDAMDILTRSDPYLMILDESMPEATPEVILEFVRGYSNQLAILVLVSSEKIDYIIELMKAGADDVINKERLKEPESFLRRVVVSWEKFKDRKNKEGFKLPSQRLTHISPELIEIASQTMTVEEFKELVEFSAFARANVDDWRHKLNKVYTAIFENNGSPSIRTEISDIKRSMETLVKSLQREDEEAKAAQDLQDKEDLETKKIKTAGKWTVIGVSITSVGLIIGVIIKYLLAYYSHIPPMP